MQEIYQMTIFIAITQPTPVGKVFDNGSETGSINLLLKMLQDRGAKIIDVKPKTYKKEDGVLGAVYMIIYEAETPLYS